MDIYHNFRFGRGVQKLFKYYNNFYGAHRLTNDALDDKENINMFSMMNGPGLLNNDFSITGAALTTSASIIASSFVFPEMLLSTSAGSIFNTSSGPSIGTCAIPGVYNDHHNFNFGACSVYVGTKEFRNATVVSGVELICPSGNPTTNVFAVVKLPITTDKFNESIKFLQGNTLIYQKGNKGSKGIGRIAFDSHKYFDTSNVLLPEHDFKLKLKVAGGVVGTPPKKSSAEVNLKVWIHTENEGGYFWTWTPAGEWVKTSQADVSGVGGKNLINKFSHGVTIPPQAFFVNLSGKAFTDKFKSKASFELSPTGEEEIVTPVLPEFAGLTEADFVNLEVDFNTRNFPIKVDEIYYKEHNQVHKAHQNYVFEVYINESTDKIMILDSVSIQDLTLQELAKIDTEFGNIKLSILDLYTIFRFFKTLYKGLDEDVYGVSGGSRLNYRDHPAWKITGSKLGEDDSGTDVHTIKGTSYDQYTRIYLVN